jgi:hypothetical protein
MTDIRKSDSQLDAEAAGLPDIESAIRFHRALSQAELFVQRLHDRDGESGLGPPFSERFRRYLDAEYGAVFPWSAGLKALRYECRKSHSEHWHRPEWHGSLCNRLVHLVIREGWSFHRACYELYVSPPRTQRVFLNGLRRIEQRLDEIQSRETEVVKSTEGRHDWLAPAHVHHAVPGLHQLECEQCKRRTAA